LISAIKKTLLEIKQKFNLLIKKEFIMSTFVEAVKNQTARTENGMRARKSTASACVDLFFKIGASRGKDITKDFVAAYVEDKDVALRIAHWVRDVRGGSGERELFRQILSYLEKHDKDAAAKLLMKTPEIGRWDDIFVFSDQDLKVQAFNMLGDALRNRNGLAAKWTPRQGPLAAEIRKHFGMSPKFYRKSLVEMTNVVEQQMCAGKWDDINYSHVPSLAASRYKKAFTRHGAKFAEYVEKLKAGDASVKVNAAAVYPYDVLKGISSYSNSYGKTELDHIVAQWEALPNYVGDASILPLVDVSGSMSTFIAGGKTTAMDVAVSLGLYLSEKNKGKFKDTFLTFSSKPELLHLKGNVVQKMQQMVKSNWDMSTDLHAALNKILATAVQGNVPQEEMPAMLLILSDMQFNACVKHDNSAIEMINRKYENAGYNAPAIVFWNLNAKDNVPVKHDASGVALVSGFSPAVVKSVLSSDMDQFTPEGIMLKTVMVDRYAL
jgi:hypothetical protein